MLAIMLLDIAHLPTLNLFFLDGEQYSGYKHSELKFQRLELTYKSRNCSSSYISTALWSWTCCLSPGVLEEEIRISFSMLRKCTKFFSFEKCFFV